MDSIRPRAAGACCALPLIALFASACERRASETLKEDFKAQLEQEVGSLNRNLQQLLKHEATPPVPTPAPAAAATPPPISASARAPEPLLTLPPTSTSKLPAGTVPSFTGLYRLAAPSVVDVLPMDDREPELRLFGRDPEWRGSGFVVERRVVNAPREVIYVVTTSHFLTDAQEVLLVLADGRELRAEISGQDPATDIAVLRASGDGMPPPLELADGSGPATAAGDWVLAVGSPFGLRQSVSAGIVSALGAVAAEGLMPGHPGFLQVDASLNPGISGAPLLGIQRRVVGMATWLGIEREGPGFAIPSAILARVWPQLRDFGRVRRAWMGITVNEVPGEVADALGLQAPLGAYVSRVVPGGPAAEAGLQSGDIVRAVGDQPMTDAGALANRMRRALVGEALRLRVRRGEATLTLVLTPRERSEED